MREHSSRSPWRARALTLAAALLLVALAVATYASVGHARAAAGFVYRYHEHTALPEGPGLARFGFDRLADSLKRRTLGASTRKIAEWKTRADLLDAWRGWHEGRARRDALFAAGIAALFVAAMAARGGRAGWARGAALGVLGASMAALAAGVTAPCLSFSAVYADLPVLGSVTLKTTVSGIPDSMAHLWEKGHAALALLLFTFSILFPFTKTALMTAAAFGAGSVGGPWAHAHEWAKTLGKWSMTDVMVVAFLFVQLSAGEGGMTSARLEVGAYFFCAHVVLALAAGALLGRVPATPAATENESGETPGRRRRALRAVALGAPVAAALLAAGWSWRGLAPERELVWDVAWDAPRPSLFRTHPFTLRLTPRGVPGLLDAELRVIAPDGAATDARLADLPAGETWTIPLAERRLPPAFVTARLTADPVGSIPYRWDIIPPAEGAP